MDLPITVIDASDLSKCSLIQGGLGKIYSPLDMLAAMVAAVSHDVEHVGRNNNFMIETSHKLALRYNDTAVMENHHAAFVFFISKHRGNKIRGQMRERLESSAEVNFNSAFLSPLSSSIHMPFSLYFQTSQT